MPDDEPINLDIAEILDELAQIDPLARARFDVAQLQVTNRHLSRLLTEARNTDQPAPE